MLAVNCLFLAIVDVDRLHTVRVGFFLGTLFGQPILAAAWVAFGPASIMRRLLLSLIWMSLLGLAVVVNVAFHNYPTEILVVMAGCVLGEWILAQVPLSGLALWFGLRLRYVNEAVQTDNRDRQFGLRQLMVVIAIVAVFFGTGRFMVTIVRPLFPDQGDIIIFAFLAFAAVILSLPLLLAALMTRWGVPGLLAVALIWGGAAVEQPLLRTLYSGRGPTAAHIVAINAFMCATILAGAVIVRLNGYRLTRSPM